MPLLFDPFSPTALKDIQEIQRKTAEAQQAKARSLARAISMIRLPKPQAAPPPVAAPPAAPPVQAQLEKTEAPQETPAQPPPSGEDEAAKKKKMLLIAGGVVVVGGLVYWMMTRD